MRRIIGYECNLDHFPCIGCNGKSAKDCNRSIPVYTPRPIPLTTFLLACAVAVVAVVYAP